MNWYYLWPVPALCLLWPCGEAPPLRPLLAGPCGHHRAGDRRVHHIALWWPALMASVVVMLLSAAPPLRSWADLVQAGSPSARAPDP